MPKTNSTSGPEVAMGTSLMRIVEWWQTTMETNSARHGLPVLTRSQSVLAAHVALGEHRPARLAAKLGVSRQAVHSVINQLVDLNILVLHTDPADRRGRIVDFSVGYASLNATFQALLLGVEEKLRERVGVEDYEAFRRVLLSDWSEVPTLSAADLERVSAGKV
ncbi:MarR family winged helix-turn-helix transcriptional regulator [Prauserella aidingensis]|uniref:MarR family winged helix-turn-helix transcriptional regulator n=1 Tax=Prauserella aidingensis TaxID=387890 RepID=UPI0020A49666|nr:helix-turn-helix domain-containing protein [Prauserella aidingensis]